MSSPLAVAAVSAVLKDLLNDGLINNDLAAIGSFSVSCLPPDRVVTGDTEPNRLNLFMYQVTPNQGWANVGLASRTASGELASNPPLALDLHYLLTAYGQVDLNAEILLGYAMELLHVTPILTRAAIRASLSPLSTVNVALIPKDPDGRTALDLADQIEAMKITPKYLSADELSRMWTAMQARYRPSMAYQVSTVLIQRTGPVKTPLPVLARGTGDQGVASATLAPPARDGAAPDPTARFAPPAWPLVTSIAIVTADAPATRQSAEPGDTLVLGGASLAGKTVTASFSHALVTGPLELAGAADSASGTVKVALPAAGDAALANWPAGNYTVSLRVESDGQVPHVSNALPFTLAPRLSAAPKLAAGANSLALTLAFAPPLWPGQLVNVYIGSDAFRPAAVTGKSGTLTLSILGVTPAAGAVPVRLNIDGVDSQLVRDTRLSRDKPLAFDPQQTVNLPNPLPGQP
ncbi:DUF4255 domain-containing protein [Paraburkholderia sp. JPY432]|uniref:Pvc16 family protein n=1 Tax=Paraburkholderia youngii TaxID=2782701 RepID=UPI0015961229|nr:Pvc16 family protein [Paraburkholderia youngii]NVH74220.1 DUF4255 domain-containing protein [Paraburkholderia youngii]